MDVILPAVAQELLREIKRAYHENSQISDEHLLGLKFIFGPTALYALDLVDQRSVTHVTSPSGRSTFQGNPVQPKNTLKDYFQKTAPMSTSLVTGSSGKIYTCYKACHYCSCPAFTFSVLRREDSMVCKHILAVYLSQALEVCQEVTVSNKHMGDILLARED